MAKRGWHLALGMATLLATTPASAAWQQATSDHFIVYANAGTNELRTMATHLEQFDRLVHLIHRAPAETAAKGSNRVTVYVAPSVTVVQQLCGKCRNVDGFYIPRVGGSFAFTPRHGEGEDGIDPGIILYHEYAHHFMLGSYAAAYPAWFSEGYAEFVSTVKFMRDSVQVGGAAQHRAYSLLIAKPMPAKELFRTGPRKLSPEQTESIYARGWLLTHYLMLDPDHAKQLSQYLRALNDGTPSVEAARAAFGDLKALDRSLDAYLSKSTIPGMRIPLSRLSPGSVEVRPLSAGEAALIEMRMQSDRGVDGRTARPLYARAAKVAAAYPTDPIAQGWLAEMAADAGEDAAAEAAADRVLAIDPTSQQALLYKARIHLRRAEKSSDPKAWSEARSWIVKANRLSPDNAEALMLYYDSFAMAKVKPPVIAVDGLVRALEIVPQDPELRFRVARQDILDGRDDAARAALRPLAYDAHAPADNPAARLLAMLDAGTKGQAAIDALEVAKAP